MVSNVKGRVVTQYTIPRQNPHKKLSLLKLPCPQSIRKTPTIRKIIKDATMAESSRLRRVGWGDDSFSLDGVMLFADIAVTSISSRRLRLLAKSLYSSILFGFSNGSKMPVSKMVSSLSNQDLRK
jgi:hypothetical protein